MRLYRFFLDSCRDSHRGLRLSITYLILSMVITPGLSWGDMYRYRTPDGRLVFTNAPPPPGSEITEVVPEHAGPLSQTTAPTAISPPHDHPNAIKPNKRNQRHKIRKAKKKARQTRPSAQAVNTHKFGLLPIGGSQAEIKRRIGPPEKRVKHGKQKRLVKIKGQYIKRRVRVESWYYPGTGRILPTHLVFYDGLLAEKNKEAR